MPKNIPIWIPTVIGGMILSFSSSKVRWQSIFPTRPTLCKTTTSQPLGSALDPKSFFGHRNKHPRWPFLGLRTPDPDGFFNSRKNDPWRIQIGKLGIQKDLVGLNPFLQSETRGIIGMMGWHQWGLCWKIILKKHLKNHDFFWKKSYRLSLTTWVWGVKPNSKILKKCKTWDRTIMTNHSVASPCCPCRPFGGQGWKYRSGNTNPGGGGSFAWGLGGTIAWPICWLEGVAVVSAASSLRSSKSMIAMWLLRKKPDEMPKVLKNMENHSVRNASSFSVSQKAEKYLGKEVQMSKQAAECHCHDRATGTRSNSIKPWNIFKKIKMK